MGPIGDLLMAAIVFSALYAIVQLFVRRKERLILVEKGTNPPEVKTEIGIFSSLKFGLFFIGIGIGVFVGNILAVSTNLEKEVAYFSMIFLFGGLSLVIFHLLDKKNRKE